MVNGSTSRILYIGAFVLLGVCIVAMAALAVLKAPAPSIFDAVIVGLLGFIVGAHIKPPVSTDGNGAALAPAQLPNDAPAVKGGSGGPSS